MRLQYASFLGYTLPGSCHQLETWHSVIYELILSTFSHCWQKLPDNTAQGRIGLCWFTVWGDCPSWWHSDRNTSLLINQKSMQYYLPFSISSDWDARPLNGFAYIQADSPLLSQIHLESGASRGLSPKWW